MKQIFRLYVVMATLFSISCGKEQTSPDTGQKTQENPAIALTTARPMIAEGETAIVIVSLNQSLIANKNLVWEIIAGANRFQAPSGSLTIPAGSTSANLDLISLDNTLYDGDNSMRIRVRDADGVIPEAEMTIGMIENDPMPFVGISDQDGVRGSRIDLAIELSAPSNLETQVSWKTADATAKAGVDYVAAAGVATIPAGETRSIVSVNTSPLASESDFVVKLTGAQNAALADSSATAHILPGNSLDTKISFATASTVVPESVGVTRVELTLSNPVGSNVTVELTLEGDAAAGSDFTPFSQLITIPAGAVSAQIPISIVEDQTFEREEILRLRMKTSTNASFGIQTEHAVIIQDNDAAPTISVADAQIGEGRALSFAVSLSQVSGADTTFSYMTLTGSASAQDFTPVAGTVTIPKGQTLARVSLPTTQDVLFESNEDLNFVLSEANGATLLRSSARGTIIDDDTAPTVQFVAARQTIPVTQSKVQVQVQLSTVSGTQATVPFHVTGSAVEGVDHNLASGVITIAAGKSVGEVNFEVSRHGPPTKMVILTLDPASGATLGTLKEHTVEF